MKEPGFRCKGSHVGYPHGRDKHRERAKKVAAQQAAKAPPPAKVTSSG